MSKSESAATTTDTGSPAPDAQSAPSTHSDAAAAGDTDKARGGAKKRASIRDRKRTEHAIISAVGTVLARDGFQGIGVNALAREAGVDKVLIYRYFGGLEQAIEAYASEVEFWPTADELAGYSDTFADTPLAERLAVYLRNLARALHRRPTTREVLAWEVSEQNDLTRRLDAARRAVTAEFFDRFVADEFPATGPVRLAFDLVSLGVIAAVLRSDRGVPDSPESPRSPLLAAIEAADFQPLDQTIELLVGGLLAQGEDFC